MALNSVSISPIETYKVTVVPNIPGTQVGISTTSGVEILEVDSNGCALFLVTSSQTITGQVTFPDNSSVAFSTDFVFTTLGNVTEETVVNVEFRYSPAQPIRVIDRNPTTFAGYNNLLLEDITLGKRDQVRHCYNIKRLQALTEYVQIYSPATDTNEVKIYDFDDVLIDTFAMSNVSGDYYQASWNWTDESIPEGKYYLTIELGDGVDVFKTLRSEPMDVRLFHTGTRIDYTNYDNGYDIIFEQTPNISYYLVIDSDLLSIDSDTEVDIFLDDQNTGTLLHDEVLDVWNFQTNCPVPWYVVNQITTALGMDQAELNRESYIKRDQGSRTTFGEYGLMYMYSVEVQKKEYDQINYFNRSEPV